MPLYTVISTRTVTEAHTIWGYGVDGVRHDVEHSHAARDNEIDVRQRPVLLDHGLRTVESITLVREDDD